MNKNIVHFVFDGILFEAPSYIAESFPMQFNYENFPACYCGAGNGFGERIIPDYIFGPTRFFKFLGLDISIKISPACWIHDKDFEGAAPTWEEFTEANKRFVHNISEIIDVHARNGWVKARALYRPVTYRNAVDSFGRYVFWSLKVEQGYVIPNEALRFLDKEIQLIHRARISEG